MPTIPKWYYLPSRPATTSTRFKTDTEETISFKEGVAKLKELLNSRTVGLITPTSSEQHSCLLSLPQGHLPKKTSLPRFYDSERILKGFLSTKQTFGKVTEEFITDVLIGTYSLYVEERSNPKDSVCY